MTAGVGHDGPGLDTMRQRTLTAAIQEREPRRSVLAVEPIAPVEAFRRTAEDLDLLLRSLSAADWKCPALRNLDVQGLVGHLIGVEQHAHRCLSGSGDPDLADADHVASTNQYAAEQRGRAPEATRHELRGGIARTLQLVRDLPNPELREVAIHGMRLPLPAFLVVRSFELWTHANDIRVAIGRSVSPPDDATLQLMTELAAPMVAVGVRRTTGDVALPVRLVLTGPGGGVWDLGGDDSQPTTVRIVTDAVDFCRVVANRLAPVELQMDVWGDRMLADTVLAGAASLALD